MTTGVLERLEAMVGDRVIKGLESMIKAAEMPPAIPIEQIKGDIARQGHPVQRLMALDPDTRRLFFTDIQGSFMYAEFGPPEEAYRVIKVGPQADIIKEYDVVDLEPEPRDTVTTTHEETEITDPPIPGVIPSGTPSDKPETDDRWLGNEGFDDEEHERTREPVGDIGDRYEHNIHPPKKSLVELGEVVSPGPLSRLGTLVSKQPPRPGLIPQTGDPMHPGRWIRPEDAQGGRGPDMPDVTPQDVGHLKARKQGIRDDIDFPPQFIPDNVEVLIDRLDSLDNREVGRAARKEESAGEFSSGIIAAVKRVIQERNKAEGPGMSSADARMDRLLRIRDSQGRAQARKF